MSTSVAVRTRTAAPAVNLLPPEYAEREQLRKLQAFMAVVVVASVLLVGALYLWERSATASAQQELDAVRTVGLELLDARREYAHVPQALTEMRTAEGTLSKAMGDEVRWSGYLARLSRSVPKNVWLTDMSASTQLAAAATPPGVPGAGGEAPADIVGQVTFKGYALKYSDVADWLRALDKQKGYTDAWGRSLKLVPNEETGREVVSFESSVTLTSEAKSGRYTDGGSK